jgi:hypothetical protein
MKPVILLLLMSSLPGLAVGADSTAASRVVDPSEAVAGLFQAEWSRAWWQWAGSFKRSESPVADRSGARCQAGQSGNVWFLAGTYGTARTIRTCTIPAGKYLYFPLINYVVSPSYAGSLTCEAAKDTAHEMTDDVSSLVLALDGQRISNLELHRQATPDCFDLAARAGGGVSPSAANGYYVMLRPLSRGTHTLEFGGILPGMSQAVTYTLKVE